MMAMVTDSNLWNVLELIVLSQNSNLSVLLWIQAFIHCLGVLYLCPKYNNGTTPVAPNNILFIPYCVPNTVLSP